MGNDNATKVKLAAVHQNNMAIASLTLAFTSDELINMIMLSQNDDWPEGLASKVVKQLEERYKPEDIMSLVDEKIALNKIRMGQNEDPKKLFEKIKAVETRFNTKTKKISEAEKIAVVLSQAPLKYQAILTSEQQLHKSLGTEVKLSHLQEVMN